MLAEPGGWKHILVQEGVLDEDAVDRIEEVVAGRSCHRPARRQRLGPREDLLDDDEQRTGQARISHLPQLGPHFQLELIPAQGDQFGDP